MNGAELVAQERTRQQEVEGYDAEHDLGYVKGELLAAAGCYFDVAANESVPGDYRHPHMRYTWPWAPEYWNPSSYLRNLVRCAALICAEIDRYIASQPDEDSEEPDDLLYTAWSIIANGQYWDDTDNPKAREWVAAATRWRDRFHETIEDEARKLRLQKFMAKPSVLEGDRGVKHEPSVLDQMERTHDRLIGRARTYYGATTDAGTPAAKAELEILRETVGVLKEENRLLRSLIDPKTIRRV